MQNRQLFAQIPQRELFVRHALEPVDELPANPALSMTELKDPIGEQRCLTESRGGVDKVETLR